MRKIELPFGHHRISLELPNELGCLSVIEPHRSNIDAVRLALIAPIDSPSLCQLVKAGQKIVIITSDITRPCPSYKILPPLMEELGAAGVRDEDVTVIFGLGTHRKQTDEERISLVGSEMAARLKCIDSDPDRTVFVGRTSRGTAVEVFEPVVEADVRIVLGNVEPHYFAGYSGGAKAIVPGVCSAETIRNNHALMVDPRARSGNIEDNPVRLDIEEGAALVGIDFILNVVLDSHKDIVYAVAGHPITAHRMACRVVDALSMTPVQHPADIVIVSAGGYPKDLNMYQAQKALDNAALAVKPGGIIIWVAQCAEGFGSKTFEEWLVGTSVDQIIEKIQQDFVIGGHKAAAIARVQNRATIMLISDMADDIVRACRMEPYHNLDEALQCAIQHCGPKPDIVVIPEGASVLPKVG